MLLSLVPGPHRLLLTGTFILACKLLRQTNNCVVIYLFFFSILPRDAIEKLFPDAIRMRSEDIQQNSDIAQSLRAFQKYGNDQIPLVPSTGRGHQQRGGGFFSGVLTALTGVAVSPSLRLSVPSCPCPPAPLPLASTVVHAVEIMETMDVGQRVIHHIHRNLLGLYDFFRNVA